MTTMTMDALSGLLECVRVEAARFEAVTARGERLGPRDAAPGRPVLGLVAVLAGRWRLLAGARGAGAEREEVAAADVELRPGDVVLLGRDAALRLQGERGIEGWPTTRVACPGAARFEACAAPGVGRPARTEAVLARRAEPEVGVHAEAARAAHGEAKGAAHAESAQPAHPQAAVPVHAEAALPAQARAVAAEPVALLRAEIVCSEAAARALSRALPRPLRVAFGDGAGFAPLRELLLLGARESAAVPPRAGAHSLLARLAELLLVETLRRHAETVSQDGPLAGWLAGLRDPQVGRALELMHAEPGRPWTLAELARKAALSRSALAERFAALVGEPPMQYLTRWRLALAARALRAGAEAVTRVAERAGYESDAAFSRAFKREFGLPPARWRRAAA